MKRDLATRSNRAARMPVARHSHSLFSNPWFDEFSEPTRWFENLFPMDVSPFSGDDRFLAPAIDIDETDNEFIVSTDLPGIKKEDISIECSGNQLSISAERKCESTEGRKNDRRERFYGSYQRSFTLPAGADMDKVEASYDGGVLTVQIPKGEQAKSRRVEIGEKKESSRSQEKH